jgi:hypothetical protein
MSYRIVWRELKKAAISRQKRAVLFHALQHVIAPHRVFFALRSARITRISISMRHSADPPRA